MLGCIVSVRVVSDELLAELPGSPINKNKTTTTVTIRHILRNDFNVLPLLLDADSVFYD